MKSKRLLSIILVAVTIVMSMSLFVGCANDGQEETYPYYTFPTESEPLKEGAYFITDLGYKDYQRNNKPENRYARDRLYAVYMNNRIGVGIFSSILCPYYENGLYRDKAPHYKSNMAIAMVGDLLYIKTKSDIFQFKYDPEYTVSTEEMQIAKPEEYIFGSSEANDKEPGFGIRFQNQKNSPFGLMGEVKPAGEDDYTIFKPNSLSITADPTFDFASESLRIGKNMVKIYVVGGPLINWEKKIVRYWKDSPSLLFEVDVAEDNSVNVIQIN